MERRGGAALAVFVAHALCPPRPGALKLDADSESWSQKMAALTPGFSGAEIANVCNEAALIAARRSESVVTAECFDAAIDRVIAGIEKKDLTIDPYERRVVAFHEAGHAIMALVTPDYDTVTKVTIIPRSNGAGGFTLFTPSDERLEIVISECVIITSVVVVEARAPARARGRAPCRRSRAGR